VTLPSDLPIRPITNPTDLASATAAWAQVPALAIDTEFVRERTFFQRLGLVQVCDGSAIWLVDPVAVPDLEPLSAVLRNPEVLKVVHSASEDIEVCFHRLRVAPAPLFDTQVAAGLAGMPPSLGYGKLVTELLGIELVKAETRTDWMARPLSEAQLAYAAEDVLYLLTLYERLRDALIEKDRLAWALEDSTALLDPGRFSDDAERAYLRLKAAPQLTRAQLGLAQALAAWREREARGRDLPRSFLLRDDLLVSLARRPPKDLRELKSRPAYDPRAGSRFAADWLEVLTAAAARNEHDLPDAIWSPPSDPASRKAEDALRQRVRKRAEELGIAPEVLAPRRVITALLQKAQHAPEAEAPPKGWRRAELADLLDPATPASKPVG
jgi:ribonuclease D